MSFASAKPKVKQKNYIKSNKPITAKFFPMQERGPTEKG
jgi:hypothetical protein